MKGIMTVFMAFIITATLMFSVSMDAMADNTDKDFDATLAIGNQPPEVVSITPESTDVVLTAGENTTFTYVVEVYDPNGWEDLNHSAFDSNIDLWNADPEFHVFDGSMASYWIDSVCSINESASEVTTAYYDCEVEIPYFAPPASATDEVYEIYAVAEDNAGETSDRLETYIGVLELAYVDMVGDDIDWNTVNVEEPTLSLNDISLTNLGNINFDRYDITGHNLSDNGVHIDIDTFGLFYGYGTFDYESVLNFSDGTLWIDSDFMVENTEILELPYLLQRHNATYDGTNPPPYSVSPLSFVAEVPSGTPSGDYTSVEPWSLAISE